ncbi:MAG: Glu/Leu/Phe/Val dehydrogenase dimerization domain-containing protein [Mycobacteriales bacterium]
MTVPNTGEFAHEQVAVRTGRRSGLPVIVAVHSTALGPALGGCRLWQYPDWRDGLADALRLSAGMTVKNAMAGLPYGGGKTVLVAPAELDAAGRRALLLDAGDAIEALGGQYVTGPDAGTGPADMAVIGERTAHVTCRPREQGGSGGAPSAATAAGVLAALRAVCREALGATGSAGGPDFGGLSVAVCGLGHVGTPLVRELAAAGAELVVADVEPARKALADEVGARWAAPADCLTAEVDVLVPAALGGVLTAGLVPRLRCRAVVGPANNQLATAEVAGLLHRRGIVWVPDEVVSAGGVVYAVAVERDHASPAEAGARVAAIGDRVAALLATAARTGRAPAEVARDEVAARLAAATPAGAEILASCG